VIVVESFQSTLPAGGATARIQILDPLDFISIHAPRGGSDRPRSQRGYRPTYFNPRSPRGERRGWNPFLCRVISFQSTLPAGGATSDEFDGCDTLKISIHAPRGGSDQSEPKGLISEIYFNPRSPRGERPALRRLRPCPYDFNPRSPRGERLCVMLCVGAISIFQSTLPAGGATLRRSLVLLERIDFNPRSPRGERQLAKYGVGVDSEFQSTLPAGGATWMVCIRQQAERNFNPRSPRGERLPSR